MSTQMQGVDFAQHSNWERVTAPSGAVYYKVPETGMLYSPQLNKYFEDPSAQYEEKQKAIKLAEQQNSPLGQMMGVAGPIAGVLGGKWAIDQLGPKTAAEKLAEQQLANVAGTQASAGAGTAAQAFTGGAPATPEILAINNAGGSAVVPSGFSLGNIGAAGNYILPAAGALGAYDLFANGRTGARGIGQGAASGAMLGSYVGMPWLGAGIGAVAGLAGGMLNHKSTKEYEKERWGDLEKKGVANAGQAFLANHAKGDDSIYDSGARQGQKWNFENALEDTKKDPTHFQHVYGNYKTFGNDWSTYNDAQQKAIVSRLANEGLYKGNKGDVVITDANKARQIKDEVLAPVAAQAPVQAAGDKVARSNSISPGIGLDGKLIGQQLAKRVNARGR